MENYEHEDELYHYGRKGMKWGQNIFGAIKTYKTNRVRRKNLEKARQAKIEKQEHAKKAAAGKLSVKQMTDEEIVTALNRMDLEQKYNKARLQTSGAAKAKSFVSDIAEQSIKNIGIQATTYALGTGVNKFAKDVLGIKNAERKVRGADGQEIIERYFEDIVNPRKGQKDK